MVNRHAPEREAAAALRSRGKSTLDANLPWAQNPRLDPAPWTAAFDRLIGSWMSEFGRNRQSFAATFTVVADIEGSIPTMSFEL